MIANQFPLRPVVCAALLAVSFTSNAAFTTYNSQANFLSAVSAPGTDTFNDLALGLALSPLNRTAGAYSYSASAPGDFFPAGSVADVWLSSNVSYDTITFSGFSSGVTAIGGLFFGSNLAGNFFAGQTITLVATDASGSFTQTLTNTTQSTFFGFVSTTGLISLTVAAAQANSQPFAFPTINNLTLAVSAVPEPATYALMLAGLGVVGFVARRRRC